MIYLAGDKYGFKAIAIVESYVKLHKFDFQNLGVINARENMKLEDMIPLVARIVLASTENCCVLSCGTGVGVEVGANKFSGIRACLATTKQIAQWARVYDNCNVLCLVGWENTKEEINQILDAWFSSTFDGDRDRLSMFDAFDSWR